jgi:DNA-binding transcriptional regulator YdaS (Cro superfamily)
VVPLGKAFDKLANQVARQYEKKGVSPAKAKQIGKATAGKVYREQLAKKK